MYNTAIEHICHNEMTSNLSLFQLPYIIKAHCIKCETILQRVQEQINNIVSSSNLFQKQDSTDRNNQ